MTGGNRQARDRHTRFLLAWNARRLVVIDRDVEAIIRTHVRDRQVAAWLHETAEIDEVIASLRQTHHRLQLEFDLARLP